MADADDFFRLSEFPARVLFWRVLMESMARRRNPLFNEGTGLTPDRSAALDWLHGLSLGCFQTWVSFAIHTLLRVDAWDTRESNLSSRTPASLEIAQVRLDEWQRQQARAGRTVTPLSLKAETFGKTSSPACHLKGAETNWFLEFLVVVEIPLIGHRLVPAISEPLLKAGQCLFELLSLIRQHKFVFPTVDVQRFHSASRTYLRIMHEGTFNLAPKPKDNFLIHLSRRIMWMGSPSLYGNWTDESINRLLREVAAGAHSTVHDKRVLAEFPLALAKQNEKRARLH